MAQKEWNGKVQVLASNFLQRHDAFCCHLLTKWTTYHGELEDNVYDFSVMY